MSISLRTLIFALVLSLAATAAQAAGHAFRDCPTCPQMLRIPAGQFVMGSPEDEVGRGPTEGPQRQVSIRTFAIGRFDITVGEWKAFVIATHRPVAGGCAWASASGPRPDPQASWRALGFPQDDRHPVVCVTFADAQAYARWLSARTARRYRLPTEAEWEYAARAGSTGPFPWGPEASHDQANYGAEACCSGLAAGRDRWAATSPVGAFPPNAFGLYDMNGEVLQWVEDCFHAYDPASADGAAYTTDLPLQEGPGVAKGMVGLKACAFRMLRGGDWGDPPRMIRSGFRNYAPPKGATLDDYRSAGAGFRIARDLD